MAMKRTTILSLMLAGLALAGCVKQEVVRTTTTTSATGELGPALVIEGFMRALNVEPKDLMTMGRLFGTKNGPIVERDPRAEVEQRMFAIGSVLKHDDYQILREQQVPGRTTEATQLVVNVVKGDRSYQVPFTMVRYKNGWLIEQIGIDAITNAR